MNWLYLGLYPVCSIEDIPRFEEKFGFLYRITNLVTGKIYIGKKAFVHNKRQEISKREQAQSGTRKKIKVIKKDSGWLDYYGSSKELKADVLLYGKEQFKREILAFSCSKKNLSYLETKAQFEFKVLEVESYNANIAGKFYRKDTVNCPEKIAA